MQEIGRAVIILGSFLVVLGVMLSFSEKIPFLGKLPGDILVKKDNFTFYAPIATSILVSIVLSILFWLFSNLKK